MLAEIKKALASGLIITALAGCQTSTVKEIKPIYNIPLSPELQAYTLKLCEESDFVEPEIAFAVMDVESSYQEDCISYTSDYGLMQLNPVVLGFLNLNTGITDLMDPYQNIRGGIFLLDYYIGKYHSVNKALMAYHLGEHGAGWQWLQGNYTCEYSDLVLATAKEIS